MFCSDQDPGGLLLLPEKGVSANFDINEVLSVMGTLLLVAAREVTASALLLLCASNASCVPEMFPMRQQYALIAKKANGLLRGAGRREWPAG